MAKPSCWRVAGKYPRPQHAKAHAGGSRGYPTRSTPRTHPGGPDEATRLSGYELIHPVPPNRLPACPSAHPPVCPSVRLPVQSAGLPNSSPAHLLVDPSTWAPIRPAARPPFRPSARPPVYRQARAGRQAQPRGQRSRASDLCTRVPMHASVPLFIP